MTGKSTPRALEAARDISDSPRSGLSGDGARDAFQNMMKTLQMCHKEVNKQQSLHNYTHE